MSTELEVHPIALRADLDVVKRALRQELQDRERSANRLRGWLSEHFEVGGADDKIRRVLVQRAVCLEAGMLFGPNAKRRVNQLIGEVFGPTVRIITVVGVAYYGNFKLRRPVP